jgi:pimeloyl-ACP methyl ester carboxylesterase
METPGKPGSAEEDSSKPLVDEPSLKRGCAGEAPALTLSQGGAGPDVVLIHGALVTHEDMIAGLYDALVSRWRVTAFDRPGHGRSPTGGGVAGSPWTQAQTLRAAWVAAGVERPLLVGHSFGGAVAVAAALQFPDEVRGVLSLAPICFPELRLEHLVFGPRALPGWQPLGSRLGSALADPVILPLLWRAMFLPQAPPERFLRSVPFDLAAERRRTLAEGEDALLMNLGLTRSLLAAHRCRVPTIILGGAEDLVVNNALHGRVLAQILPNGRFETRPGLGHMLHHFDQPRIVEHLEELTRGGTSNMASPRRPRTAPGSGLRQRATSAARRVAAASMLLAAMLATPAAACTLCHSPTSLGVRRLLLEQDPASSLAAIAAPLPVLVALILLAAWEPGRRTRR